MLLLFDEGVNKIHDRIAIKDTSPGYRGSFRAGCEESYPGSG